MSIHTTGVRYDVIAKDSASKVFKSVGDGADRLGGRLGKLVKGAAYAGAAIGGAMAAGMVKATSDAVRFEATMKRIQTQAGASAGDVKVLSKQVLELGKTSQQGPQHLAEALYHLKSVGMDNVDAMKALKTSSDLAAVGGADLESTTNALAGAWRTGIKGATDFGTAAATVNAIIGAGNMTMEDLTAALGTGILPTAKTFGLTFAQVGGALALFTDEGVDSASAATRLRMSISLLAAGTPAANKQLAKIHLTTDQLGAAMRKPDGLIGAIGLLKDHLDKSGLSAVKQSALLSRAFGGGKSSSAILSMINNLDVMRQKQDQVNRSMGKFPAAVVAQRKTAAAQLKILESNLQVFSITVGDKLLPPFTKLVTYINGTVLPALGEISGFVQTRMLPVVERFGRTMTDKFIPVGDIKAKTRELTGDMQDFLGALFPKKEPVIPVVPKVTLPKTMPQDLLNYGLPPAPTITPKVKLPSSMPQSLLNFGFAPHTISPPQSAAAKAGEQARKLISGGIFDALKQVDWGKLGTQLSDGLGKAIDWVAAHGSDLAKRFAKVVGSVDWVNVGKVAGVLMIPMIIGMTDSMFAPLFTGDFWRKHWLDAILAAVSVLPINRVLGAAGKGLAKIPWGKLGDVLDHIPWGSVFRWTHWITDPIGGALAATGRFVGRLADGFTSAFSSRFPRVAQAFADQLLLLPVRIGDLGRLLKNKGGSLLTGWGTKLVESIPGWGNKFIRGVLKVFGRYTFWQTGIQLVQGLLGGVENGLSDIGHWIKTHVVDPVVNWTKSLFGIRSPSTVFASIGGWLMAGLKTGVIGGIAGIGKWLYSTVISPVIGAFANAGGWLYSKGSGLVSGLRSGAAGGMAGTGKWVTDHIKSPLTSVFAKAGTWLYGKGQVVMNGFFDGLKQPWHDVQVWVGGVAKWIKANKGPISLDRQLLVPAGKALMHGLLEGLKVGFKGVGAFVHKTGSTVAGTVSEITSKLFSAKAPQGPNVPLSPGVAGAQKYAAGMVAQLWPGSTGAQMSALRALWNAESGWRANAENMSSGAYGIPQALPASKMASAGPDWRTNAATQIRWGLSYIRSRYGDPETAWASWNAHKPHWYAKGGLAQFGETAWVGERGPELMQVTPRGTRIYNNRDSMAIAGATGMQTPGYAGGTVSLGQAHQDATRARQQVNRLEKEIAALRRAEALAHTRRQRKADQLAIMAAEQELKAARTRLTAANKELTAAQAQAKRAQGISNTLSNGFLKQLETGSAAAIASAVKSMNSKLQAAGAGSLVAGNLRTASKLESLANQKASVAGRIAAAKQYASDQSSSLGDYLSVGSTSATSVSGLILQMQAGQRTAGRFAAETARLSKAGLSKTLLSQLAAAGPGSQLAATLAGASPSDIRYLNQAAAAQDKLTTSFGRTMADAMYDSGAQAGKGFLTGLMAQEAALQKEMDKLAAGMVNAIKKRLGIKSPSRVMHEQVGKQVALGAAGGVAAYTPHAVAAVQRMADTMAAIRARTTTATGGRPGPGAGAVAAPQVRVHVHFDDPTLRDLIRVEVDQGHVELAEALRAGGA